MMSTALALTQILYLVFLFTMVNISPVVSLMADSQIVVGQTFQPNVVGSLLETTQFIASSNPVVADCGHLCLRSTQCLTAVFEQQSKTCAMYRDSPPFSGSLVANSTGVFTTIVTDKVSASMVRIPSNVNVSAIWNVSAGQNSLTATPGTGIGQYWYANYPKNVFDGDWTSTFVSYGIGNYTFDSNISGLNTGVYLTIPGDTFCLKGFRFVKGGASLSRDPMAVTIEGSNQTGSALTLGSSWTLIYTGTTGLDVDPGNNQAGVKQSLTNNTLSFSSYRFIITSRRSLASCVEYTEIELYQ